MILRWLHPCLISQPTSLRSILIISFFDPPPQAFKWPLTLSFPTKTLYYCFVFPIQGTYLTNHSLIHFTVLVIPGGLYKPWNSSYNVILNCPLHPRCFPEQLFSAYSGTQHILLRSVPQTSVLNSVIYALKSLSIMLNIHGEVVVLILYNQIM